MDLYPQAPKPVLDGLQSAISQLGKVDALWPINTIADNFLLFVSCGYAYANGFVLTTADHREAKRYSYQYLIRTS